MMATVNVTCNVSPCEVVHTLDIPLLNLDESGALLISGAILSVWAVGYAIRLVIRALHVDEVRTGNDGD